MGASGKRELFPMIDWPKHLTKSKEEFEKLYAQNTSNCRKKIEFEFIKTLGQGAFGRVYLGKFMKDGRYFAIKVLEKVTLVKRKQVQHAMSEKRILQALNDPFCVYLEWAFQDNSYLYMCLPFVNGGDMFKHLRKTRRFDEPVAMFYGAQVLLAFEYLHYCNMVFRDLKPENIMIDDHGYLRLTDFGFCKLLKGRAYTMCGTPEYLAPEIIKNRGYGQAVDWWSYGILLFEMNAGHPPFQAIDQMKTFDKIISGKFDMPHFFSAELKDLISNILQADLSRRYGNLKDGISDIKNHAWYKRIDWGSLFNKYPAAPFIPLVQGENDTSNFDMFDMVEFKSVSKDLYSKEFEDF